MLTCMQKVNFVIHFSLEILQRNGKFLFLVILECLATDNKNDSITLKKCLTIISRKNSTPSLTFSLRYYKDIIKLLFWVLWGCTRKVMLSICREFLCLSAGKKSISQPMLFWRYCKDMQTYFGQFGHVWLYITKMLVSTFRRLRCLSACQK